MELKFEYVMANHTKERFKKKVYMKKKMIIINYRRKHKT